MYIQRIIKSDVLELIENFPIIGIIGPRQVGKTTFVKELISQINKESVYLDLELPEDLSKLQDPQLYLEQHEEKCIILDEIQRLPGIFNILRALIDRKRQPGRFIVLGSASPHLLRQSSETLAGRIVYAELSPLNLMEVNKNHNMANHWFRGGFPEAFLSGKSKIFAIWMRNFIQTYLERDLPMLGLTADSILMRRFWTMIAHYHGGIWNASTFANSLGVTVPTINRYLNFLEGAFIVRRLKPYYFNTKKRLVKSPKIYIRDTGILHYLAGISDIESLHGHSLIGHSWEGYAIEQIYQILPGELELFFYRTHHGAECDLVLVKGIKPLACIEIKYTSQPKITKGFRITIDDLKTENNFIITPQSETYPVSNSITVSNLGDFLSSQLSKFL